MKTATLVVLGVLTALLAVPAALADGSPTCDPVWIDSNGMPHVDPDCLPCNPPACTLPPTDARP
jgi:hypothetical protein